MMNVHTFCRDCKGSNLIKFLDLGRQPLANGFLEKNQLSEPEERFPLEVFLCSDCNLAQLTHVVEKEKLFNNYLYFSSAMPKIAPHWQEYAEYVIDNFLAENDFVMEIGSNDGVLLRFFKDRGYSVLGIDPAANIAEVAKNKSVPTMTDFFCEKVAENILRAHGQAKAILANNVFAHIDDHESVCLGVKKLLSRNGVFVIEAPYLMDMFENLTYDTIYHEHLSFLAVRPLRILFDKYDLEIFDVKIVSVQGNSLRIYIGHKGERPVLESVQNFVSKELSRGLNIPESYFELAERIKLSREKLVSLLSNLKKKGERIAGYGAPAKGNTLLNYCHIGTDILDYCVEDLPSKQGLYTPGLHIPVISRDQAAKHNPTYFLLLAWNYTHAILEKENEFRENGGKFIIPVGDEIRII